MRTLSSLLKTPSSLKGKRALLRLDLNVPMHHGKVTDTTRIDRSLSSVKALQKAGAKVVILSHFGRPKGEFRADMSLAPIADALGEALGEHVFFGVDCVGSAARGAVEKMQPSQVLLLENLRFHTEEEKNESGFAQALAELGDLYVNDAFSCSHRAHASIAGIALLLPSCAGLLLEEEVGSLRSALEDAQRPIAAIVGGSKISTKIDLLARLSQKTDYLMIGGGMANTFLYAQGHDVGASLCEKDKKKVALDILKEAKQANCTILLPTDGMLCEKFEADAPCRVARVDQVGKREMMLDIGPETLKHWCEILEQCKTAVWNGPVGAFEIPPFNVGSASLARYIALRTQEGKLNSVAGGGDVLAALKQSGLRDQFSYISTAGGAFLEWLEGKELPGIKVLMA